MSHTYEYPRAAVTVDVAVFRTRESMIEVLLIRRGKEPFKGKWALPGGHVEEGEDLPTAAARELLEETNLELHPDTLTQVGAYGKPGRDPRGWYVDVAYTTHVGGYLEVRAGDDAAEAQWFDVYHLPEMAFDHEEVISDAYHLDSI